MRILTYYPHYPMTYGRFITRAFERLGHEVIHTGEPHGTHNGWNDTPAPEKYVDVPQGAVPGWRPDLVVVMDEYMRPKPTRCPGMGRVPHVFYATSNNAIDPSTPDMDHLFLGLYRGPALPYRDDGTMTWIGCGYDPTLHTPSPIPWREREYDVCFIGAAWNKRVKALGDLREAGLKVFQDMGLMFDEYVAAYHNARFGLVCAGDWPGPNMRFYETPAMGVIPLVHQSTHEDRFGADDAVLWYTDIVPAVKWWLANPSEAEMLLTRAQAWVKPHTWDARAQDILDWYGWKYG